MSTSLQLDGLEFEVQNYNNDFIILKTANPVSLHAIGQKILSANIPFIDEVIATETEICLKTNDSFDQEKLTALNTLQTTSTEVGRQIELPFLLGQHKDFELYCEAVSLPQDVILKLLEKSIYKIAMFGFLPGFVYMNGLNQKLHTPRKTVPSKSIPKNTLAIGGQYLGIYSIPSPGGWYAIGELACSVLDLKSLPPVKLQAQDEIVLKNISASEFKDITTNQIDLKTYNGLT